MVALKSTLRFPYDGNNSLAPRASLWKRIRPSVEGAHFFVCTHRSPVSEHRVTRLWECESSRLRREFVYKGNQKARVQLKNSSEVNIKASLMLPHQMNGPFNVKPSSLCVLQQTHTCSMSSSDECTQLYFQCCSCFHVTLFSLCAQVRDF